MFRLRALQTLLADQNLQLRSSLRQMQNIEASLRVLRKVKTFSLRAGMKSDLPDSVACRQECWYPDTPNKYSDIESRCRQLIYGSTPVEKVFEMNSKWLAYAQTFERDEQFTAKMDPEYYRSITPEKGEFVRCNPFKSDDHVH